MAPKPPPAKGPAPAPAPGPAPGPAPPRKPSKFEEFLSGYNCATLGILMLFCLFLYTLWYISLCTVEKTKRDPLRAAVAQIRRVMIARNAAYGDLNDTDLILEAEKEARKLLPLAQKIKEIEAEIADLHYKLNDDWVAHRGHLYLISPELFNFVDTKKLCNDSKAYLVDIHDEAEEVFLEDTVRGTHSTYYIGLTYWLQEWKWNRTLLPPFQTYWKKSEPSGMFRNKCARLLSDCKVKLQCWATIDCSTLARGICKKKAEDKWFN